MQGRTGQEILKKFNLVPDSYNSLILVEGESIYTRSTGALRISRHLGGGWRLLYVFIILPKFIRDQVYNLIARNRYKWFGKKESCPIPTAELKAKFLDG